MALMDLFIPAMILIQPLSWANFIDSFISIYLTYNIVGAMIIRIMTLSITTISMTTHRIMIFSVTLNKM
jgi:hypothetical protein